MGERGLPPSGGLVGIGFKIIGLLSPGAAFNIVAAISAKKKKSDFSFIIVYF